MFYQGRAPALSTGKQGLGVDVHVICIVFESVFILTHICAEFWIQPGNSGRLGFIDGETEAQNGQVIAHLFVYSKGLVR